MADTFELTSTYVIVSGQTTTTHEGGQSFWRRLGQGDPALAAAGHGWLISSYRLDRSWSNWEMHPAGDEIVHCRSGACELVLELAEGSRSFAMIPGATVVIPKGTWHTVKVDAEAELLHITYGQGTTFKPVDAEATDRRERIEAPDDRGVPEPTRVVPYADGGNLDTSREFYTEVLGFEVAMEAPVLGLTSPANRSAQVLIPAQGFDDPQPKFGIDLGDPQAVDAAHAAAVRRGLRIVYPLRDEPWGVRRFFVEDPGGTIVNVLAHTT
jgi:catechol 2,3-dioxygenase-like lactoylglutathione lyase family enzyme/uncharacterized cupin superfamily protein